MDTLPSDEMRSLSVPPVWSKRVELFILPVTSPVTSPVTLPTTLPVKFPLKPPPPDVADTNAVVDIPRISYLKSSPSLIIKSWPFSITISLYWV